MIWLNFSQANLKNPAARGHKSNIYIYIWEKGENFVVAPQSRGGILWKRQEKWSDLKNVFCKHL